MPKVAAAVGALDARSTPGALRGGDSVGVSIDGHEHALGPDDVQLVLRPREGYQLERSGGHAVALDLSLDESLRREGLAREVVHAVQSARKGAGLAVEDRIELVLAGDEELLDAVREHERYVATETLAVELSYDGAGEPSAGQAASIEGREIRIALARA
jgi:isoleucyl-tRNA synthetase